MKPENYQKAAELIKAHRSKKEFLDELSDAHFVVILKGNGREVARTNIAFDGPDKESTQKFIAAIRLTVMDEIGKIRKQIDAL